ncbi:MAG: hypothetical protein Q4D45_02955 [Lachnospiraceae bacterium]|nr:hypothetical protein [Lachnospiraceae bacterium]
MNTLLKITSFGSAIILILLIIAKFFFVFPSELFSTLSSIFVVLGCGSTIVYHQSYK